MADPIYLPGYSNAWSCDRVPTNSETPNAGDITLNGTWWDTSTTPWTGYICTNATPNALQWAQLTLGARSFSIPTFNDLTTAQQLSTTRDAQVICSFPASVSATVLVGQSILAELKYADDAGMTTNVITASDDILAIASGLVVTIPGRLGLNGFVPKGKYRKIFFTLTGAGATAPTARSSAQQVLL